MCLCLCWAYWSIIGGSWYEKITSSYHNEVWNCESWGRCVSRSIRKVWTNHCNQICLSFQRLQSVWRWKIQRTCLLHHLSNVLSMLWGRDVCKVKRRNYVHMWSVIVASTWISFEGLSQSIFCICATIYFFLQSNVYSRYVIFQCRLQCVCHSFLL